MRDPGQRGPIRLGRLARVRSRRLWVVGLALVLTSVFLPVFGAAPSAEARPIGTWGTRFSANDNGNIQIFGNALLTCPASDSRCAGAHAGTQNLNNNSFPMVNLDADADPGTFNSSSAEVAAPAQADVLWAGLYWGARLSSGTGGTAGPGGATAARTMLLRTPVAGYSTVTSQDTFGPTSGDQASNSSPM